MSSRCLSDLSPIETPFPFVSREVETRNAALRCLDYGVRPPLDTNGIGLI